MSSTTRRSRRILTIFRRRHVGDRRDLTDRDGVARSTGDLETVGDGHLG
jgi:hypothetical protein